MMRPRSEGRNRRFGRCQGSAELPAVAPGALSEGGFLHLDELLPGVGVDLAWGRCDLINQGAWDREPLLAGILDGHWGHKLGIVADDGVNIERRIAGAVHLVGWAGGVLITHVCFCHGVSCGTFVLWRVNVRTGQESSTRNRSSAHEGLAIDMHFAITEFSR